MAVGYYLMHKEEKVAKLRYEEGKITLDTTYMKERMPIGTYTPQLLNQWFENRAVPKTRNNTVFLNMKYGVNSNIDLLLLGYGLSVNDCYWFKPVGKDLCWENINLYENQFEDITSEFDIPKKRDSKYVMLSSSEGELGKIWFTDTDGIIKMAKSGMVQSANEILGSIQCGLFGWQDYVTYTSIIMDNDTGKVKGCLCNTFTSSDLEFVPAIRVVNYEPDIKNESMYDKFIRICVLNDMSEDYVTDFLERQILLDYIITNTDRHFSNFGILRDSNTLKWVKMAPMFDFGNSMFFKTDILGDVDIYKIKAVSFVSNEYKLLGKVKNYSKVDFKMLIGYEAFKDIYKGCIPNERIEKLYTLMLKKSEVIERKKENPS